MKKLVLGLSVLFAMNVAHASQDLVPDAKQKAVRTLKSIAQCPVFSATAMEVVLSGDCVEGKIETALAHLQADEYYEQIASRIDSTLSYRRYAGGWNVYRYTKLAKLANAASGGKALYAVEDAIKVAIEEIEMFE